MAKFGDGTINFGKFGGSPVSVSQVEEVDLIVGILRRMLRKWSGQNVPIGGPRHARSCLRGMNTAGHSARSRCWRLWSMYASKKVLHTILSRRVMWIVYPISKLCSISTIWIICCYRHGVWVQKTFCRYSNGMKRAVLKRSTCIWGRFFPAAIRSSGLWFSSSTGSIRRSAGQRFSRITVRFMPGVMWRMISISAFRRVRTSTPIQEQNRAVSPSIEPCMSSTKSILTASVHL